MTSLIRIASVRAGLGLALLVATSCTWAQTPELARASATHQSLAQARTQEDRLALHDQLQGLWSEALAAGKMLEVEWENFNNAVVDLGEGADRMVMFTWNVELDNRTQRYGGWVVHAAPGTDLGYTWTMLTHDPEANTRDLGRMHRHDRWQGGLYYDGVLTYDKQQPVYTFLVWDGADALTTQKWVETVEPRNGRVRFGSPRFELPEGLQKRLVLTYADAVQATLKKEEASGRIVMDHLAPEDPSFQGQYAFYGPTLSYDALEWRKGRWHLVLDTEVRNEEGSSPREYRDPSRRRGRN